MRPKQSLLVEIHFDEGARYSQHKANKIEYHHRVGLQNAVVDECRYPMDKQIRVRAQSELGTVFPRLQTLAIDEIVKWFPVVERFVAVGDVRPKGGANASAEKRFECNVGTRNNGGGFARRNRTLPAIEQCE